MNKVRSKRFAMLTLLIIGVMALPDVFAQAPISGGAAKPVLIRNVDFRYVKVARIEGGGLIATFNLVNRSGTNIILQGGRTNKEM